MYSLEYVPELATQADTVLSQLGYRSARLIVGDGSLGLPAYAPYDGTVVAAASSKAPPPLLTQLTTGAADRPDRHLNATRAEVHN